MGLTADMAQFVAATATREVPHQALEIARTGFVDCIAVIFAGWDEETTHTVRSYVGAPKACSPLLDTSCSASDLALVHAVAAHVHDYDDTGLSGHPSAVLVPAILAEALKGGHDGMAMLKAYVAGYEVWAELASRESDSLHAKGWHPSAVLGCPASAAAISALRGFSTAQCRDALALAASMTGGVVANFGSMAKPYQLARASQAGIVAADLVACGMRAAADALEHPVGMLAALSPQGRVDCEKGSKLGEEWHILRQGLNIKLYPVCYAAHRCLDAAWELKRDNALAPDEIERVDVEMGHAQAAMLRNHEPVTSLDAKFSAEFCLAAMFYRGRCGRGELTGSFINSPNIQAFMKRVHIQPIHARSEVEPSLSPFDRVTVTLRDGRRLRSRCIDFPLGHFRNPASLQAIREKFFDCTSDYLSQATAGQLFEQLRCLEELASVQAVTSIVQESEHAAS